MMENETLNNFTIALSSSSPTPSGGGASALVGALAASLGSMVGNLTVGKKKYVQYQDQLIVLLQQGENLRVALLNGIEEDAKAFEPLSKAYSIPKEDPSRAEVMEKCLKQAAQAPFNIVQNICKVIDLLEQYEQVGSKLVISDVATGAMFAYGALYGAAINVKVNTKLMNDHQYSQQLNDDLDQLLQSYGNKAMGIYNRIEKEMH